MKSAPAGREFYFNNGRTAKNIAELLAQIKELSSEQYQHYVNDDKNDFYNWVYQCIDKRTARKIKGNLPKVMIEKKLGK